MEKTEIGEELVMAEKEGQTPREFTMLQLESMGTDPGGKTYDGWKVTTKPKEPSEVTLAKQTTGGKDGKPADTKPAAAKAKPAVKEVPVKPLVKTDETPEGADPVKPEAPQTNGDGLPQTTL